MHGVVFVLFIRFFLIDWSRNMLPVIVTYSTWRLLLATCFFFLINYLLKYALWISGKYFAHLHARQDTVTCWRPSVSKDSNPDVTEHMVVVFLVIFQFRFSPLKSYLSSSQFTLSQLFYWIDQTSEWKYIKSWHMSIQLHLWWLHNYSLLLTNR